MFRNLLDRIRATPLWVWISILLAAGVLVVSWLIYKHQSGGASTPNGTVGYVPSDGSGQPIWPVDTSGLSGNGYADLIAYLQYINSQKTPNPPGTAHPTTTTKLTLNHAESLQQVANEQHVSLAWLKSWNAQLANQPGYNKTWWTLPAGTAVNIPHA